MLLDLNFLCFISFSFFLLVYLFIFLLFRIFLILSRIVLSWNTLKSARYGPDPFPAAGCFPVWVPWWRRMVAGELPSRAWRQAVFSAETCCVWALGLWTVLKRLRACFF